MLNLIPGEYLESNILPTVAYPEVEVSGKRDLISTPPPRSLANNLSNNVHYHQAPFFTTANPRRGRVNIRGTVTT
jgi:hypothetical protein